MHASPANSLRDARSSRSERLSFAVRITLLAFSLVALGFLLQQIAIALLLVFGGILLAILLRTLAEWTARGTGLRVTGALSLVLVLLMAIAAGGLYLAGQAVANQFAELADQLPMSIDSLREELREYQWGERLLRIPSQSNVDLPISNRDMTVYASDALAAIGNALGAMLLVLFLAIYLAYDPSVYLGGAVRLMPVGHRAQVAEVLAEVYKTLQRWLLGKIVAMVLVGACTTVGLAALGVRMPLALGAIAALLTFVPNFGPVVSAIPAVLIAMLDKPWAGAYVALMYLAIQTVESYLVTPLIQQRAVALPPALTLAAQVGMGLL